MFTNTRQSVAADNIIVRLYKLITSAAGQLQQQLLLLLLLTADRPKWSTYPSIIIVEKSDRSNLPHKQRTNWLPLQQQQHLCATIRAAKLLTKPCTAIVLQWTQDRNRSEMAPRISANFVVNLVLRTGAVPLSAHRAIIQVKATWLAGLRGWPSYCLTSFEKRCYHRCHNAELQKLNDSYKIKSHWLWWMKKPNTTGWYVSITRKHRFIYFVITAIISIHLSHR